LVSRVSVELVISAPRFVKIRTDGGVRMSCADILCLVLSGTQLTAIRCSS
jgi:hypothetical protein